MTSYRKASRYKAGYAGILQALVLSVLIVQANCQSTESGWQSLFNGKDLTGWRELNGTHKWEVKDSMIIGTDVPGQPNGFLCTEKEYSDFILELEVSIDTLMNNSGVQFRSLSTPDYQDGRVHGYQMEIDPKPQRWSGSIYDEGGRRGWIYTTELNPAAKTAFKNNVWNKYRIECIGTSIRTWVNAVPVANLIDAQSLRGFIGLQLHTNNPMDPPGGNQVRFRKIFIKTKNIRPSPADTIFVVNTIPNNLSLQEKRTGYSLLWDGKTFKGWRDAYGMQIPKGGWDIKDSALIMAVTKAADGGKDIMTRKEFGPFILKFDFRFEQGANSGVKYFVREPENGDATRAKAIAALEFQVADDSVQGITATNTLGSMTGILAAKKPRSIVKGTGEWNQAVIKVFPDNLVEYWLNGLRILECRRGSPEYLKLLAQSKYKDLHDFGLASKGHLLLESGSGVVSYRSIKIKELDKR